MDHTNTEQPQISAYVSVGTKKKLDQLARARGLRKAFVMEQALQYYFRSLEELPEETFLPPRLVLSPESFERVLNLIDNPSTPTKAMLELMNDDPDSPAPKG
jgi:uncharacterized protein (DUF1778 family)